MVSMQTAAATLLELCKLRPSGILHVAGTRLSRFELGLLVADALGVSRDLVVPGLRAEFTGPEPRQKDLALRPTARDSKGWLGEISERALPFSQAL